MIAPPLSSFEDGSGSSRAGSPSGSGAENALPTPAPSEPPQPAPLAKPRRKAPAWEDPDDGALQIDLDLVHFLLVVVKLVRRC